MAFEQYCAREWKPIAGPAAATSSDDYNGCFDCNICLEFAYEPVVTFCGHLYCWPCIYKWLHVQNASDEHPQCPVCKADISHATMVPLYGRGQTPNGSEPEGKPTHRGVMVIPPRPPACGNTGQRLPHRNHYQHPYSGLEGNSHSPSPVPSLAGTSLSALQHPLVGMFGEMVYAWVFGSSGRLYAYPRLRRHEIQADKSLNRISIFLFCCFLLCLIVF